MTRIRDIKTTFTAGEVSREILGRGDLRAYENGALALRNVFIKPTGGVTRRAGMAYVDEAVGDGRLIAFEFNTQQTYLLVLSDAQIDIYENGVKIDTIPSPWSAAQLSQIAWTQSADTLLLVHPEVAPKKLVRQNDGGWMIEDWVFFTHDNRIEQPHFKFVNFDVSLTPSGISGEVTINASAPVFTNNHEGLRLRIQGREVDITAFNSPTVITATVIEELPDTTATIDWTEPCFSPARGYPATVAFHQDRLVIGGSRDLPNRVWFSKSGDLFNFDLGEGLDDEAIEFSILSDQVNAIRGIFSGRHLQVFTSGAEWMVTGDPLTPGSVQVRRQTRVGSIITHHVPPINVDGATLYLARNGSEIHEFLYTDLEQAYKSTNIAVLSEHMVLDPVDMDYDPTRRLLYVVRGDGRFAALTVFRAEQVAAWTLHETAGAVKSVAVVGANVYMLVARNGAYFIEQLDNALNTDSALSGVVENPVSTWSGLDHLNGQNVNIVADGVPQPSQNVIGGAITLSTPAYHVEVGLPYTHEITPLPPSEVGVAGGGRKVRLVEGIFRLQDTAALRLDTGRGAADISLGAVTQFDSPPVQVSGDIRVRALGWLPSATVPLWSIRQDTPLGFTLLSVTTEIKVND